MNYAIKIYVYNIDSEYFPILFFIPNSNSLNTDFSEVETNSELKYKIMTVLPPFFEKMQRPSTLRQAPERRKKLYGFGFIFTLL